MIHLRKKDREVICDLAQRSFTSAVEIWAYGSRVDGTSHETSDLDLVIRGPELKAVDISELQTFIDLIQDSQIPILIQVFDWARIPESFRSQILRRYEVLYRWKP